ncbi:MAG: PEGA domain-containing protein [candidate division WOR-3 bacterium]
MKKSNILVILCLCVLSVPFVISAQQGKDYLIKGKNLLMINKDYEKATLNFRNAIDLGVSTVDSAICYFGIAICAMLENDRNAAKGYIRKALEVYPSFTVEMSGMKEYANDNILAIFGEIKREMIGKVSVESEPSGLDIYLDGVPIGKTPKQLDNVLAGKHSVKVAGQIREIIVEADRTNRVFFTIKKPENVRNTKCYGVAIDNSALLDISYRNWFADFNTFNTNLGIRGLASYDLSFVFSIGYLRHIFPDYDVPRSIILGGEVNWSGISISGEGTDKTVKISTNTVFSLIIGSEYYFKRAPISIATLVHIRLARYDADLDPTFDAGFYPIFSCGINFFK